MACCETSTTFNQVAEKECREAPAGLADDIVPGVDAHLNASDDRPGAVADLDDLHEVSSLRIASRLVPPVVEDHQVGTDQLPEQAR